MYNKTISFKHSRKQKAQYNFCAMPVIYIWLNTEHSDRPTGGNALT